MKIFCIKLNKQYTAGVLFGSHFICLIEKIAHRYSELLKLDNLFDRNEPVLSMALGCEKNITAVKNIVRNIENDFTEYPDKYLNDESILPVESVDIVRPVLSPSKIIAVGMNYMDHCLEFNIAPPQKPILFAKLPSSIINPGDAITWDPALTDQVDYEAELAVVIKKTAYRVRRSAATDYIAGYTCLNDITARDLQSMDGQWTRGKSIDTFCPLGPCLATRDEIPDPQNLSIQCRVNGELLQDSSTSKMIFSVAELIEFISHGITLLPGDIIATGTPHGVGNFRNPKKFLKPGDVVEVFVGNIGILQNSVGVFHPVD